MKTETKVNLFIAAVVIGVVALFGLFGWALYNDITNPKETKEARGAYVKCAYRTVKNACASWKVVKY